MDAVGICYCEPSERRRTARNLNNHAFNVLERPTQLALLLRDESDPIHEIACLSFSIDNYLLKKIKKF